MSDIFEYDGSQDDRGVAVETFYNWGAWELAEELYDARQLAREFLRLLVENLPGLVINSANFPDWILR